MKKIFLLFLIILSAVNLYAQFGKNKVQYKNYVWYFIQTDHFDIYFNEGGETLTEFTAQAAEEALKSIQKTFNYKISNRITLIIYNSQNDFQETNVIDMDLSEGIQGFTELFKNRVVVQFTGSYKQFRHLIHHELVHAVMNDMYYGGSIQNIISNNITLSFPLWFSEGLAEYESLGWDVDTDMFIRDAVVNESLPDLMNLDGYFAYRGGQSVLYYIANKYGKQKIAELMNKIRGSGNFQEAFKQTIGIDLKEFGERWKREIKKTYWPDIATRQDPEDFAKRLTNPKNNDGFFNSSPALSPQGDKIAFISNRDFFFDVFLMDANDGKIIKKLVKGNVSPDFEDLNILTPGLTWSPDGKNIALSAKSNGYDNIYIINIQTNQREMLPIKMDAISSVAWSRDGRKLAFVGQNKKQSDIYIYDFETKQTTNITNDIFGDYDPSWSVDNLHIYFSSDRGDNLVTDYHISGDQLFKSNYSQKDIYKINIIDRKIKRITNLPNSDETNVYEDADGKKLILISDINGINNIFTVSNNGIEITNENEMRPITNSLNGLYQLSLSYDSQKLAFSTLHQSNFNIFLMNNPFESKTQLQTLEPTIFIKKQRNIENKSDEIIVVSEVSKRDTIQNNSDDIKIFTGNIVVSPDSSIKEQNDYSRYIFGRQDTTSQTGEVSNLFSPNDNLDEYGNFKVRKYKVTFAPDLVYANAGYSTFYGLIGTTILSFSDVLGDHRLIGVTGLQIDLKNSDYGLAYYNLRNRINYGIEGFHTARFVNIIKGNFIYLYRFRNLQVSLNANYPLNRFYRFEAGLSYMNVRSENLDDIRFPLQEDNFFVPSLAFVHDNTLWGYTAPIEGTRYRFDTYGNPGFGKKKLSFWTFTADYRTYFRFWTDYGFAMRFSMGYSSGSNAQRFFMGGTENWINRSFATTEIPLESNTDFAFLSVVLPMRGFDYSEKIGTKYALMNYELRFPLIRYIIPAGIPVLLNNILGVIFFDAGTAWTHNDKLQLFTKNQNDALKTKDLLLGTGVGSRVYLFGFILKFDLAWSYTVEKWSKPKFYFSLGLDF
ncbi:MAG: peptidase MA family metallohydrolase [Ignavibacterium sp.]|nr:peptidase MA family metallohydrolase [Ignavibacterium sp.]MCX7611680.1 peptidase MA family metallohydrolase [Ignavibacterium sp.]MDW8375736.1 peptidase MA family metallohydrolase [Ignavibacteriales bacterium]